MINKECEQFWQRVKLVAVFLLGLGIGGLIVSLRYDVEIRNDQVDLQIKVAKIEGKKAAIYDLARKFIFHTEQVILERQELRELRVKLSKGE